jgi:hypothetical protein
MPLIQVPLAPYLKDPTVFRCPKDNGGELIEGSQAPFPVSPSLYEKYGSSYFMRTDIVFKSLSQKGYWPSNDVTIMFDAFGHWHAGSEAVRPDMPNAMSGRLYQGYRYNVLFGDMHVKVLDYYSLQAMWRRRL